MDQARHKLNLRFHRAKHSKNSNYWVCSICKQFARKTKKLKHSKNCLCRLPIETAREIMAQARKALDS